jgi:hypothetical protein
MNETLVVPCFYAQSRRFQRVVGESCTGEPFQDICTKSPKWFRGFKELFRYGFVAGQGEVRTYLALFPFGSERSEALPIRMCHLGGMACALCDIGLDLP